MDKDKKEMKAVHLRDLSNLLTKIEKKDDFDNGKIKCKFCKNTVTKENIYSLLNESGAIHFICDKAECISEFMTHLEKKKGNK